MCGGGGDLKTLAQCLTLAPYLKGHDPRLAFEQGPHVHLIPNLNLPPRQRSLNHVGTLNACKRRCHFWG